MPKLKLSMKLEFFLFIVIFSFPSMLVFADSTDEPNSLFIEGFKYFVMGDFEKAISYFDRVLEIDPTHLSALARKGEALEKLGKVKDAISYFDKVTDIDLDYANEQGTLYLDKILSFDNQNVNALYKKGKSLGRYNNTLDLAISYFDTVLDLEPKHVNALYGKGEAYFQYEDFKQAILFYDKALDLDANHVGALSSKGYALANLGNFEESNIYTDKALAIEPDNVDALYKKGSALLVQNNSDEALLYFYKALKIDPNHNQSDIKFSVITGNIPYKVLDGFVEVWVRDSQGSLVAHLKVRNLTHIDHQIFNETINEWPIKEIINRNGKDYEVHQKEEILVIKKRYMEGGASDYGVYFPEVDSPFGIIHASYWQYQVEVGDAVTVKRTVFKPI